MTEVLIRVQVPDALSFSEIDEQVYETLYEAMLDNRLQEMYLSITDEVEA
jgi:hypothetical protein